MLTHESFSKTPFSPINKIYFQSFHAMRFTLKIDFYFTLVILTHFKVYAGVCRCFFVKYVIFIR